MSITFVALVTILYLGACISFLVEARPLTREAIGYAGMFFGYVIANLGFMYALYK